MQLHWQLCGKNFSAPDSKAHVFSQHQICPFSKDFGNKKALWSKALGFAVACFNLELSCCYPNKNYASLLHSWNCTHNKFWDPWTRYLETGARSVEAHHNQWAAVLVPEGEIQSCSIRAPQTHQNITEMVKSGSPQWSWKKTWFKTNQVWVWQKETIFH